VSGSNDRGLSPNNYAPIPTIPMGIVGRGAYFFLIKLYLLNDIGVHIILIKLYLFNDIGVHIYFCKVIYMSEMI
jgi:hypothetical protein